MKGRALRLAAVAAIAAAAALPTSAFSAHAAKNHTVKLKNLKFSPKTITIKKGDTVTWKWADKFPHDVTGPFGSSGIKKGATYKVKFSKTGTFSYVCNIHKLKGMKGKVVVK
jgi:plastocyanin